MDELQQKIVDFLQANGGEVPYPDLLAQMDFQERAMLPRVLHMMKVAGVAVQQVAFDPETKQNTHTVRLKGE